MTLLHKLSNTTKKTKNVQRVGRGPSSGRGKTSSRGQKGQGSRSGSKRRYGREGGQMPLFKKLPTRGFTRGRFIKPVFAINLDKIEQYFNDGELVNFETLLERGIASRKYTGGLKVLSNGELNKKVTIEANAFSAEAKRKLEEKSISFKIVQ